MRAGLPQTITKMLTVIAAAGILFGASLAHAQCTDIGTDGLVGHWKLDETSGTTATDSAGSNNGTYTTVAPTTATTTGQIDTAIDFGTASNGYVSLGNNVTALQPIANFTVAGWVKFNSFPANYNTIYASGDAANSYWFFAADWGATPTLGFVTDGGSFDSANTTLVTDRWYHVAVTHTGSDFIFYLDGQPDGTGSDSLAGLTPGAMGEAGIGRRIESGSEQLDGVLDDVRLYNRILSADEIAALFAQRSNASPTAGQIVYNTKNALMQYCDGTEWVMMGTGSYNPNAVTFDGTNDRLDVQNESYTDTKQVTASFWFRRAPSGTFDSIFNNSNAGSYGFGFVNAVSDAIAFSANNSSSTLILEARSNPINDSNWHHVMASFDLTDTNKRHIYVDNVDDFASSGVYTDDLISVSTIDIWIGGNGSGPQYSGDLADLWVDYGTYIDLSVEANRRKFISESGMPMYLGPDGSIPTGEKPEVFLSGDTISFHSNRGSGGGFTENGEITTAATQPASAATTNQANYFVLTNGTWTGALGGNVGADEKCLSDLNTNDWLNKPSGTLSQDMVRAFLCADVDCTTGLPSTTYTFARSGSTTDGGGTFTTDGTGDGPNDSANWSLSTQFGLDTTTWTGMDNGTATNWPGNGGCNCSDFSLDSGAGCSNTGNIGDTNTTGQGRWQGGSFSCGNARRLYCFVDIPTDACVNPLGAKGAMQYSTDFNVMEYCNGVDWVAMGPIGGTPPATGLVGHWKLDETSGTTAADSSGNGYNGTWNGDAAVPSVAGQIDTAMDFDGTDDYIEIADNNDLDLNSGNFSVFAWIYPRTFGENSQGRIIDHDGGVGPGWSLHINDSGCLNAESLVFQIDGSCTSQGGTVSNANTITLNTWQYVGVTMDDATDTMIFYVDGEVVGTNATVTNNPDANTSSIRIGLRPSDLNRDFDGYIDDVRVYNRTLSAQEIQQLYYYGLSEGLGDVDNACANPARDEGNMLYNGDNNLMQYCNGEEWIKIGH